MDQHSISIFQKLLINALKLDLLLFCLLITSSVIFFFFFKNLFAEISVAYGFLMVWLKDLHLLIGSICLSLFIVYLLNLLKNINKKSFLIIVVTISLNLLSMIISFDYAIFILLSLIFLTIFLIIFKFKNYIK